MYDKNALFACHLLEILTVEAAGRDYRYMMVFEKKEFQNDGAYTLDEFAEVIKKL